MLTLFSVSTFFMIKKTKLLLMICVPVVIMLLVSIVGVYRIGSAPSPVKNLSVNTCYADMVLSWDNVPRATSYNIYASRNGSDLELIGSCDKNNCEFTFSNYEHDVPYSFRVAAVSTNPLTGKETKGDMSEEISAKYDSTEYAQKIPVLTYHFLCRSDEPATSLTIPEDAFDEQMNYLHENGYTTLTPDEFYEWHKGKADYPRKTVMITFDDGGYEVYHFAYPIIKKYGFAATLFCVGDKIPEKTVDYDPESEKTHFVGLDMIEKINKEYPRFCFESHTYDMHHRVDGKIPVKSYTHDQLMDDFRKNEKFGYRYLAYPWGAYNDQVKEVLKECNYNMAFAYRPFYYALRSDDVYAVNRIKIKGTMPIETFIEIVEGNSASRDNPDAPENSAS